MSSTLKRKRRPRKKPGSCQMPRCRRLGNRVGSNQLRLCDKHAADNRVGDYVKARDGRCVRCGVEGPLDWAHVISRRYTAIRWSYGTRIDDPWNNSVALCRRCHMWQTQHPLEGDDFFRSIGIDLPNLRYLALHDPPADPSEVLEAMSRDQA